MTGNVNFSVSSSGQGSSVTERSHPPKPPTVYNKFFSFIQTSFKAITSPFGKQIVILGFNVNPLGRESAEEKGQTLRERINREAYEALRRAAIRGGKWESTTGRLHAELDQELRLQGSPEEGTTTEAIAERGVIAPLPLRDPEVTRAIPLQAQVDATNWKAERDRHLGDLSRKLSTYIAVLLMRKQAGITEKDNVKLLKIVDIATTPGQTQSVWSIFTNHYDLGLGQKLIACLNYLFWYQTDLISNTVQAYLETLMNGLTQDLTSENASTRFKFLESLIQNANEFLIEDIRATKQFAIADQPGGGDLKKYREGAIAIHYGNSLEKLCRDFAEKRVEADSPNVPFFRHFQQIPLLKHVFKLFEWVLNIFLRKVMKSYILPSSLQSVIENGLQATQPHNLPFFVEMTRLLTGLLDKLRQKVANPSSSLSTTSPLPIPGTEMLPTLVKNLTLVLDLEPFKTQAELKQKFREIEAGKQFIDKKIEEAIGEGVKDGLHHFLEYLNELFKTHECTAHSLRLCNTAFSSSQNKDPDTLMAEFTEEQLKLKRSAKELFEIIIQRAVDKKINKVKPEEAKQVANQVFKNSKTVFQKICNSLHPFCEQMRQKIERAGQAPQAPMEEGNNIQGDIAQFLETIQVLITRKEIQEHINFLPDKDKEAIWRQITPIYERVSFLQQQLLELQELQAYVPAHTAVAEHLRTIRETVESISNPFQAQPRHLRSPLIETLKEHAEETSKLLGAKVPATLHLQRHIEQIDTLSNEIAQEQQVLDALYAFSPIREGEEEPPLGLFEQLRNHELGSPPPGFQLRACLDEVNKNLSYLPQEEERQLRALLGSGRDLSTKWDRLGTLLQRIYETHRNNKERHVIRFNGTLRETEIWAQDKADKYDLIKREDLAKMQKIITTLSTEVNRLREDTNRLQVDLPFYLTSGQTQIATSVLGASIGVGLTKGLSSLGGPIGAAIGTGISTLLYTGTQNLSELTTKNPSALLKTGASFIAATTATYFFPSTAIWASIGGGALTGWDIEKALHKNAKNRVLPAVLKVFNNAHDLLFSPRVPYGALTRALTALRQAN